jgi:uncharacterized protein YecA (UPF0149 family)
LSAKAAITEREDQIAELKRLGCEMAQGFLYSPPVTPTAAMRHDGWAELVNDEKYGDPLIPMMILYHEHDEDREMRPEPITLDKREKVIAYMAAGLLAAHKYFRERWKEYADTTFEPPRRAAKVGRNDPCPCGSGKKYKKCCGGAAVN